jgi:hypothetical protein
MRKQLIRHPEYLTGFVYDTRSYEKKKKNRTVTVWKVRFPDAPGGMQDFEMESAELEEAIKLYVLWAASNCKMAACDDDDDC